MKKMCSSFAFPLQNDSSTHRNQSSTIPIHFKSANNFFFNDSEHQFPTNNSVIKDSKNQVPKWLDDVFNLDTKINPNQSHEHNETQQQQATIKDPWQQQKTGNLSTTDPLNPRLKISENQSTVKPTDDLLNPRFEVKISENQSTVKPMDNPLNPRLKISENQSTVKPTDDPLNLGLEVKISENQSTVKLIDDNNFDLTRDDQSTPNLPHDQKSESNTSLSRDVTKVTVHLSHPKRVLLMAYMRGGSSFLGQMFVTNPEAIFWFELVDPMYGAMMGLRIYNNAYEVTHFRNGTRR